MNNAPTNTLPINTAQAQGANTPGATTSASGVWYTMWLYDTDGTPLAKLSRWHDASVVLALNKPDTLTFSYPTDRWESDLIVFDKEVWLFRGDANALTQKFIVIGREDTFGAAPTARFDCVSVMGRLGFESVSNVTSYNEIGHKIAVSSMLSQLLAKQTGDNKITLGSVANVIGMQRIVISASSDITILAMLGKIVEQAGGVMRVTISTTDNTRRLDYLSTTGFDVGHQIRLDKNATSIKRKKYWGSGTLDTSYNVGTINLGAKGVSYDFDEGLLDPGTRCRLILDIDDIASTVVDVRVTDVTRQQLDNPANVSIGVADSTRVYLNDAGVLQTVRGRQSTLLDAFHYTASRVEDMGAPVALSSLRSRRVQITAIQDDYLECVDYDMENQETGDSVNVAKPPYLRLGFMHGKTITYENGDVVVYTGTTRRIYSATDGVTTENQIITPDYHVGELLETRSMVTGITDAPLWEDSNQRGRALAWDGA